METISTGLELKAYGSQILAEQSRQQITIVIPQGTCCRACGSEAIVEAFKEELYNRGLQDQVIILETGCHGFCQLEPFVVIQPKGILYQQLKPKNVKDIIEKTILSDKIIQRLCYRDPMTRERYPLEKDIPFYKRQQRTLLGQACKINPESIEDYFAIDGYQALFKTLETMSPEDVIEEVKNSRLRGRGGAGFLTGVKWGMAYEQESDVKYIICNADEGDPGAYMDRSLLEGNPHAVIEGMLLGAYAIGAAKGFIYVRDEYPLAVKHVNIALEQARKFNILGENIGTNGFSFDIEVDRGAGAFVCGEETALISSIEGKGGEPRQRPPYPVVKGLWGKPTNINNVETWANVPGIIRNGADEFASIGTENSKGSKIFALVGKINNTGLVEVPMGITLKEIVYDIGGGIPDGNELKAVQTGGPSGGCIPGEMLDLQVDYAELAKAGSMMGSGGMIVMDDSTCMVDLAKYFLTFLKDESCGKCFSCREGITRMLEIVTRFTEGRAVLEDIELLERTATAVMSASMCGLGQTAANPVLSTLKHFRNEYILHAKYRRCSAKVCKDIVTFFIVPERCTGCTLCAKACPVDAITARLLEPHVINESICISCRACLEACKFNAVEDIYVDIDALLNV